MASISESEIDSETIEKFMERPDVVVIDPDSTNPLTDIQLKIVRIVEERSPEGITALEDDFEISYGSLQRHVTRLRDLGIVESEGTRGRINQLTLAASHIMYRPIILDGDTGPDAED